MRDRFLRCLIKVVLSHPRLVLGIILLLLALSLTIVPGLEVEAGHSKLEDKENIHQRRFNAFLSEFGSPNLLIALAEGGNERLRQRLIDALANELPRRADRPENKDAICEVEGPANSDGCVRDVMGRIDLSKLKARALLYLAPAQVEALVEAMKDPGFGLATIMGLGGLQSMFSSFTAEVERRASQPMPKGEALEQAKKAMKMVTRVFDELTLRVQDASRGELSLEDALVSREVQSGIDGRGYLSSKDGKIKLSFVRPVNDSDEPLVVVPFVNYVQRTARRATEELSKACEDAAACPDGPLKLTLTGLPAIVADEQKILTEDITLTTIAAISGILCLFVWGFRSLRQTVLGLLPLLTGLLWTLAFVRLAFGSMNMVTSAFIVTLLGLGIDFAVHLLSRFNESRAMGKEPREAAEAAMLGAGPGILTGALTTSGAFAALAASRFMAFSQLGIITGVGLVFVLLVTLTMMPAMLVLPSLRFLQGRGGKTPSQCRDKKPSRLDIPGLVVRRRWFFVGLGLVSAALMLLVAQRIPWSYDYLELMPSELDSVEAMATLARRTDFSAEVAALVARGPGQAKQFTQTLLQKKTIARVESLVSYLPQNQHRKLKALNSLVPILQKRPVRQPEPVDLKALDQALEELSDSLENARFEARRASKEAAMLKGPAQAVARLRKALKETPAHKALPRLQELQKKILAGIDQGLEILRQNAGAKPMTAASLLAELPAGLRDRMYHQGRYAVYVYPAEPIWDKQYMARFIADLRSVQPEATGFPVTHYEIGSSIELGFRDASIIALVALVILLLLDFRSPRYTLLALAPLGMGIAWMWGGISLLGMSYNFVNIIAFPLIIGIGVASGVHILHRFRQEGEQDIAPVVRFTGMAIFLSAATTMVGFGSLTLAQHRGAATLGIVLLLGVGACLATALFFLPALLRVLKR